MKNIFIAFLFLSTCSLFSQTLQIDADQIDVFTFQGMSDIDFDDEGRLWVCTNQKNLYVKEDGAWSEFTVDLQDQSAFKSLAFNNGVLYMGTEENGIFYYTDFAWGVFNTSNGGSPVNNVSIIEFDHDGTLWLITTDEKLYSRKGTTWTDHSDDVDGFPVRDIFIDSQNIVYVYDGSRFWRRFSEGDWDDFNLLGLGVTDINDITEKSSPVRIWLSTNKGLISYSSAFTEEPNHSKGRATDRIIIDDNGLMWMFTLNAGVITYDFQTGETEEYSRDDYPDLPFQARKAIVLDDNSIMYIGLSGAFVYTMRLGPSGIDDNEIKSFVSYPNPTLDVVQLDLEYSIKQVSLHDYAGRKLNDLHIENHQVSLENIKSGIYILKVIDENNKIWISKIVKK